MNPQNSVEPYNIRTLYLFCGPYYLVQCYIGMWNSRVYIAATPMGILYFVNTLVTGPRPTH